MDGLEGLGNAAGSADESSGTASYPSGGNNSQAIAPAPAPQVQGLAQAAPPAAQAAAPVPPDQPHSRLLNMVKGAMVGLDAFATSAATGGREGGVGEVQAYQQKQQQAQQAQEAHASAMKDDVLRRQLLSASVQAAQASLTHMQTIMPLEEANERLKYSNGVTDSMLKLDLDVTDLAQVAMFHKLQAGTINVPFTAGHSPQEVTGGIQAVADKAGKNLNDYNILPTYNDGSHGTGGNVAMTLRSDAEGIKATPRQGAAFMADAESLYDQAAIAFKDRGGANAPEVKSFRDRLDQLKPLVANGSMSWQQMHDTRQLIMAPMMTRTTGLMKSTADAASQAKLAADTEAVRKGNRPKDVLEAASQYTQAQQENKASPSPANQQLEDNARQQLVDQRNTVYKTDVMKAQATQATNDSSQEAKDKDAAPVVLGAFIDPTNITSLHELISTRTRPGEASMLGIYKEAVKLTKDPSSPYYGVKFDPKVMDARYNSYKEWIGRDSGHQQKIVSGSQGLAHISDMVDFGRDEMFPNVRGTGQAIFGQHFGKALNYIEESHDGADVPTYKSKGVLAREDIKNVLSEGKAVPKDLSDQIDANFDLSGKKSPYQLEAIGKTYANGIVIRMSKEAEWYKNRFGVNPQIMSPEDLSTLDHLGMTGQANMFRSGGKYAPPVSSNGSGGAGAQPVKPGTTWSAAVWQKNNPGKDIEAAKKQAAASGRNVVD